MVACVTLLVGCSVSALLFMQVMSRGAGKYRSSMTFLFERAVDEVRKEMNSNMIVAQRGQLLQQVLAAFIVAGKPQLVSQLLAIENLKVHLEEQGASAAAVLAEAIIDAARIEGPEMVAGELNVETVGVVWDAMIEIGADMAARAPPAPSSDAAPTYGLPSLALCSCVFCTYETRHISHSCSIYCPALPCGFAAV